MQLAITAAIILALLGLAYWFVRRYSLGGLSHGRSKVPRLSVVDAMPVDGRRRLVLVRRDNVEHLILIGGPSDVVVEQAIARPRRQRPAEEEQQPVQVAEAQATPAPVVADNPPIPFAIPQPRSAPPPPSAVVAAPEPAAMPSLANGTTNSGQPAPERQFSFRRAAAAAAPAQASTAPIAHSPQPPTALPPQRGPAADVASPRYLDLQRPTRIDTSAPPSGTGGEPALPDLPAADEAPDDFLSAPLNGSGIHEPPAPREASPFGRAPAGAEDSSAKVSDLEREMARLLGEITQKRPS